MRYTAVTKRTFWARYLRGVGLPVHSWATGSGVAVALDLGALLSRLQIRNDLREAGVKPGSV